MKKKLLFLALLCKLLLLSSCSKDYLYVQQEWIDERYLASSRIHTPDPRQTNPPKGQKLLIQWDFPKSLWERQLTLQATVRFMDHTEQIFTRILERRRDILDLFFKDAQILTYQVEVFDKNRERVSLWKHHFWTEWIDVSKDSARKRSSSVSSQPRQASVTEMP